MLVIVVAVQWVLLLVLGVALAAVARQVGVLYTRIGPTGARMIPDGPEVGAQIPAFSATTLAGQSVVHPGESRFGLFLFMAPGCSGCDALAPAVAPFSRAEPWLDVRVVMLRSNESEARDFLKRFGIPSEIALLPAHLPEELLPEGTPFAVLTSGGRVETKGIVNNREHLDSLVAGLPEHEEKSEASKQVSR